MTHASPSMSDTAVVHPPTAEPPGKPAGLRHDAAFDPHRHGDRAVPAADHLLDLGQADRAGHLRARPKSAPGSRSRARRLPPPTSSCCATNCAIPAAINPCSTCASKTACPPGWCLELDPRCELAADRSLRCALGDQARAEGPQHRCPGRAGLHRQSAEREGQRGRHDRPQSQPAAHPRLYPENFIKAFGVREFGTVLWVTFVYTIGGTAGALVLGLFAALLLNQTFRGRAVFAASCCSPSSRR